MILHTTTHNTTTQHNTTTTTTQQRKTNLVSSIWVSDGAAASRGFNITSAISWKALSISDGHTYGRTKRVNSRNSCLCLMTRVANTNKTLKPNTVKCTYPREDHILGGFNILCLGRYYLTLIMWGLGGSCLAK